VTSSAEVSTLAGLDYVLPLKWSDDADLPDLTEYLRWLSGRARVVVVDGSPDRLWRRHHHAWGGRVVHLRPQVTALNGKVAGVLTGLRHAVAEAVVIADDDVRYDADSLARTVAALAGADLVGPQNFFDPLPWHARWDTARSLLNRAVAADYPGTFAVRRSTFERMGGYSGSVLFENLELMRTVRAHGGVVRRPLDIYVARRPASARRFFDQRVRQAYDDLAQPWRLAAFLPVLPGLTSRRTRWSMVGAVLGSTFVAEAGRRRAGGSAVFPWQTSLFAPAWVLERSVCGWLAVGQRALLGGVRYAGSRLPTAAHSNRQLRRGVARGGPLVAAGRPEASAVGAVTERLERRPSAPAQRNGAPAGIDLHPVDVDDREGAAQDQRPVGVRRDGGRLDGRRGGIGAHASWLPVRPVDKPEVGHDA
jgi:hypothetical protein